MAGHDWELRWELLVADAWADAELMKRLKADPAAVMKERGMTLPAGVQVKVLENTDKVMNMVIPAKPAGDELSEERLEAVSGGHGCGGHGCGGHGCRGCGGCGGGCGGCGGCVISCVGCIVGCRGCGT